MFHHAAHLNSLGAAGSFRLALLALVSVALAGCGRQPAPSRTSTNVVAVVDGVPISTSRFEAEYRRRNGPDGAVLDKSKVLADLIDQEAAYLKATRGGFMDLPEVQQAIRSMVVARFRESREKELTAGSAITMERARAVYAADTNRFLRPAAINIALLRVECPRKASDEKKAEAMKKAGVARARALEETKGIGHFGPLAAEISSDQASRYRGGEQGWMNLAEAKARLPEGVAQAALALTDPGQISEPIAGPDGIYLLKLVARRQEQTRPFDEVRPQIEHQLALQAQSERESRWHEWSREGLAIEIDREELDRIPVPSSGTNTPSAPSTMPGR